jgi:hypothetical protein
MDSEAGRVTKLGITHALGFGKGCAARASDSEVGTIIATPILSGLHHHYARI